MDKNINQSKPFILIGKPNSGKTSLFNLLTGLNQKVGNYSGVTVDAKIGTFGNREVIDLPGLNSLFTTSPEEKISKDKLLNFSRKSLPVIFVANGLMLEDSLMLFSEIADLQIPMAMVINFRDDLEKNKIIIDLKSKADRLGCPVILMNSKTGEGKESLSKLLETNSFKVPNAFCRSLHDEFKNNIVINNYALNLKNSSGLNNRKTEREYQKRQGLINSIVRTSIDRKEALDHQESSKRFDKVLLHPIFGILIFLFVMWLTFQSVFTLAAYPMDLIDGGFAALSGYVDENLPEGIFTSLLSEGIIPGLGGVLIFIPIIMILFLVLGTLEHSGYLSRISFISDRILRKFGLSGKSIIPLMSSWACAIPAIMSARTIDDPKERFAVIMASPLMTCSARLPVYTILIAVLLPNADGGFLNYQGLALLVLYLIGVGATLFVSWYISRKSNIEGNKLWALELPMYRMPNWRNVVYNAYVKTKAFVIGAGRIIFLISIVLWFLASFSPRSATWKAEKFAEMQKEQIDMEQEAFDLEYSYAGYLGKAIEPVIKPLGYDWKIGIALITSFAAREVFVGTLSTLYSVGSEEELPIIQRLQKERHPGTLRPVYSFAACVSLLIFYAFALQCMSTLAIVKKETGQWKYAIFQFIAFLIAAYVFAWLAYVIIS